MVESRDPSARASRGRRAVFLGFLLCACASAPAYAQRVNDGAITFTGGIDAPSVYVFRGIVRERDPKVTVAPFGNLALGLRGERPAPGGVGQAGSLVLNLGVWHSLQTGSSGSNGFTEHAHFEEDFYAGLGAGLGKGLQVAANYRVYTSPNFQFNTVKEVNLRVDHADWFHPYAIVAAEIGDNGIDNGVNNGTYLELGATPRFNVWGTSSLSIPVKLGTSLKDYYELNGKDQRFGYLSAGGMLTVPLGFVPARFGAWNLHGGAEFYTFGEFTKNANQGESTKAVGTFGIGVTY